MFSPFNRIKTKASIDSRDDLVIGRAFTAFFHFVGRDQLLNDLACRHGNWITGRLAISTCNGLVCFFLMGCRMSHQQHSAKQADFQLQIDMILVFIIFQIILFIE
ncbi:MAG: hypothetical protein AAFV98_17650 [Chloroflexota bacterium]